jgi:glutaredoxin 3
MKPQILIFTMTTCPYCIAAKKLLKKKGLEFEEVNLDEHPERWDECEQKSGRATVPQIFIGKRHVGGCEDLQALEKSGRLDKLVEKAG